MKRRAIVAAVAVAIVVGIVILAIQWPFTREAAAKSLGEAFDSSVEFGTFQQTWLPFPGFAAKNVTLIPKHGPAAGRAQAATVRVEANFFGLFRHHVRRMTADGINVQIRSLGEGAFAGHAEKSVIEQVELRNAVLRIGSESEGRLFEFHRIELHNVGHGREVPYRITVAIPRPSGELELRGKLGPLRYGELSKTPLGGSYQLSHANLGVFRGIAGILSSKGDYSGVLERLDIKGETDVPDFRVVESGHSHHLTTQFQATVNGTNGDTILPGIRAAFDGTSLQIANVRIESTGKESEKSTSLDIVAGRGRIQDLMLLFIKAPQSPILGPIGFHAHVVLPPGDRPFKQRLILDGNFGITGAGFSKASTQASADELSERAEGTPRDAPERVLSDLAGRVALRNGIATFSDLSFRVPAAAANLTGTFNLVSERIDLHGKLATEAELSKTSTGIKSVFLKLLDPVFKRKSAGAVIPVSVSGTYDQPSFHELFTK